MLGIIEQLFIGLTNFSGSLAGIVNAPDHMKCTVLNNQ